MSVTRWNGVPRKEFAKEPLLRKRIRCTSMMHTTKCFDEGREAMGP